jgi:phospholipase/carboxylesterase
MQGTGAPLDEAKVAVLMVHGRGASAQSILDLAGSIDRPEVAYVAPQAEGGTWYPNSFLAPLSANEPWLGSALSVLGESMETIEASGIPPRRTVLLGFSQGACLALEFSARHARRYGGVIGLSGGLIGTSDLPDAQSPNDKEFRYEGDLGGTPVFLGCSDRDAHIPLERVRRSTTVLRALGGEVTERIYPGMGHVVNDDEIGFVRDLLRSLLAPDGVSGH